MESEYRDGLCRTCDLHVVELASLRAEVERLGRERDEAQSNYRFMVEKAADDHLPAYREQQARILSLTQRSESLAAELAAAREALGKADELSVCAADVAGFADQVEAYTRWVVKEKYLKRLVDASLAFGEARAAAKGGEVRTGIDYGTPFDNNPRASGAERDADHTCNDHKPGSIGPRGPENCEACQDAEDDSGEGA